MRLALLVIPALLCVLCGCALPRQQTVVASYEPGTKPTSRMIVLDSIVELHAREESADRGPITSTGVISGTRVGFRTGGDGSVVAFVGGRTIPVPSGRCEWGVVETCWPRWWSRRADDAERAAEATAEALKITGIGIGAVSLGAAYLAAQSHAGYP